MEATVELSAAWRTDPGLVRGHNEDFVAVYEPETPDDLSAHGSLYIVADGVGGADAGEVASQYASERTLYHYLRSSADEERGRRLIEAMQAANTDLRQLAAGLEDNRRMATTMVAAAIHEGHAYIGNVGDSRAYLLRGGVLTQITRDQSLVARLVEEGALTPEEAVNYPYKNIILYSIGSEKRPPIDLFQVDLELGDQLLLCSDGLTRHVSDGEIAGLLLEQPLEVIVESLVRLARERGGEDNITVAVVQYGPRPDVPPAGDEEATTTIYRARPRPVVITEPVPMAMPQTVTRAAPPERGPRMWPVMLVLTLVMIILIVLLWYFIQQTTAL
ncbi:MAG TPA: protein phosphatase 2C domain-containing protein [Promineifilum sp.]|nr:protein phosphatase 2C domain-containing protein [Promineifilum sp.]